VSFPEGHQHGTAFEVPYAIWQGLKQHRGLD